MEMLEHLGNTQAIIQIPAETLTMWLNDWGEKVFEKGLMAGMRARAMQVKELMVAPLGRKEAAVALGVSETTLNKYIREDKIRLMNTNGDKRIPISEIERMKDVRRTDSFREV